MSTYLTGRDIGQTERAMQQLLTAVLASTPLPSTEHWVALTVVTNAPIAPDTTRLAAALRSSEPSVASVVSDLETLGLVALRDAWLPTAAGRILFEQVSARIQELTAQLSDGLDPVDVDTARRVLATITERAGALAVQGVS
jgi:DNA-binding MarR family transcriptional regulator